MIDSVLLERLKRRKESSVEELIHKYKSYVTAIVFNAIGTSASKEDIEEVIQDVFVSVWNHAGDINNLKAYIAVTAKNTAINKLRYIKEAAELTGMEKSGEKTPEEVVEGKEMTAILYRAIEALGEPDCEIFFRYYYNGEKISDIAKELGLKDATVKSKMKRGKEKLREYLLGRGEA